MKTKDVIKLFFTFTLICILFFGVKGFLIAILSASTVFLGFIFFIFIWGVFILIADHYEDV